MLHVFERGIVPYTQPGQSMNFTIYMVSCHVTVGELIYQLGLWEGQDDKCGISECVELGDGQWAKGISVFKKDDNRKKTLEEMGWDEDRADQKQPVWLCMHQG
jgi:hypothetical protein